MLSCRSCQQKCTNIQALSESPLEVCISTGLVTLCPWFHCFSVLVEFELLSPPKLGGDVDTMSPDQHAQGKRRNPFCLANFVSGSHARGTREIVMSGNSPRILLLHIPPTDPPRLIYRLADSMWIPCPRTNTPKENVETPSAFQTSFLEAMLGELGKLSCLETCHGAFSLFRRRIFRGGYIA